MGYPQFQLPGGVSSVKEDACAANCDVPSLGKALRESSRTRQGYSWSWCRYPIDVVWTNLLVHFASGRTLAT